MDMQTIIQVIANVGFPIAVCVGCFWFINNTLKELRTAIENNTIVITKIINKIEGEK